MRHRWPWTGLAGLLLLLALPAPSQAFIERLYSLEEIMKESTHILVGRIDKVDSGRQTAVATMTSALKGNLDFTTVQINIGVGQEGHPPYLMRRVRPGADLILFFQLDRQNIACCGHTDGTWFQLFANDEPKNRKAIWWRFTHIEIYLPRTFSGSTPDLIRLTGDVLAGRAKPPLPNRAAPKIDIGAKGPPPVAPPRPEIPVAKGGFHRQVQIPAKPASEVRGISWADLNGDGRLAIYLSRQGANMLLLSQSEAWKDAAAELGLARESRAAAWADYNGDGRPDLLTSNFELYTNLGAAFRNDSRLLAAPVARNPEGGGWIDYNGDGLPDVLITNGEYGICLWQNTGRGPEWFRDVSQAAGLGPKGPGAGNGDFIVCFDADADGYTDFLYNLGNGLLFRNRGDGTFRVDDKSGISLPDGSAYKRGIAVADFNNDDALDLFVPASSRPRLYRNNNNGTFSDIFADSGDPTLEQDPCFAAAWGDVNADGNLDLFVCHTTGSSRLYLGDGKGRFKDVSDAAGVRQLSPSYAATLVDVNGDGSLDLVVHLADRVVVAFNSFQRPPGRSPMVVTVRARKGLVGAVVRATSAEGRSMGMRVLAAVESCGAQSPPTAHFGLPVGRHRVTVGLSDGRVAQKTVDVADKPVFVTFSENEFE